MFSRIRSLFCAAFALALVGLSTVNAWATGPTISDLGDGDPSVFIPVFVTKVGTVLGAVIVLGLAVMALTLGIKWLKRMTGART